MSMPAQAALQLTTLSVFTQLYLLRFVMFKTRMQKKGCFFKEEKTTLLLGDQHGETESAPVEEQNSDHKSLESQTLLTGTKGQDVDPSLGMWGPLVSLCRWGKDGCDEPRVTSEDQGRHAP